VPEGLWPGGKAKASLNRANWWRGAGPKPRELPMARAKRP
jgi:hypothetical protein